MVHSCAVLTCKNRTKNCLFKFYKFPAVVSTNSRCHKKEKLPSIIILSKKRQNAWVRALNLGSLDSQQLKNKRVCADHFQLRKPAGLEDENHPDWVPNQKLGYVYGHALKNYYDVERHQRALKRSLLTNSTPDAKHLKLDTMKAPESGKHQRALKRSLTNSTPDAKHLKLDTMKAPESGN